MAQWIRRLPTEQEILGLSPSTDYFCWFFFVHFSLSRKTKGGDARIENATSCTRSRNHATRTNAHVTNPRHCENILFVLHRTFYADTLA